MTQLADAAFQLAADASPNGILVCDEGGTILFANQKVEAVFGYAADALVGQSASVLLPGFPATDRARDPGAAQGWLGGPDRDRVDVRRPRRPPGDRRVDPRHQLAPRPAAATRSARTRKHPSAERGQGASADAHDRGGESGRAAGARAVEQVAPTTRDRPAAWARPAAARKCSREAIHDLSTRRRAGRWCASTAPRSRPR